MTQTALLYNANVELAGQLIRLLTKRGMKVYAVDSKSLFYINEAMVSNPELEDKIIPVILPKQSSTSTVKSLEKITAQNGDDTLDLVIDFNQSGEDLSTDDFKFVSKLLMSPLIKKGTVMCFGNSKAITSSSTFKSVNAFVSTLSGEADDKFGYGNVHVVNLLSTSEVNAGDITEVATGYMDSLIRSGYKVHKIHSLMDLIYAFIYYMLPLNTYRYLGMATDVFRDWTTSRLNDHEYPQILG